VGDPPVDGNGEAWVRVARTYPAATATNGIARNPAVCGPGLMGIEFQLGIYRCIKGVLDDDGTPPDCDVITNDAVLILADQGAMRRAVLCCDALEPYDPVIGEWRPVGPMGGCAGGVLTVSITRMP
jgi:hypothetical protein